MRPEIYYGELTRREVVVNSDNAEFDYPLGEDNQYTHTTTGAGGVPLDWPGSTGCCSRFDLGEAQPLFSGDIHAESKIMLHRNVVDRARQVVPFVTFDRRTLHGHPARAAWCGCSTPTRTRQRFPYSQREEMRSTADSPRVRRPVVALPGQLPPQLGQGDRRCLRRHGAGLARRRERPHRFQAWSTIFPTPAAPDRGDARQTCGPTCATPSTSFAVQAELFATYHMQEDSTFYYREDEWEVGDRGGCRRIDAAPTG